MSKPEENKTASSFQRTSQPDADYLKSEGIGLVIAKAMAVLYKEKPQNPVDFLGKWLLNASQVQRKAVMEEEAADQLHKEQI